MKKINLSDYPPYLDIIENTVYSSNGDVIKCYKLELPEIYSLSEEQYSQLHSFWFRSFKNFHPKTVILKSDVFLKKYYKQEKRVTEDYLQRNTRIHFDNREFLEHTSYLFFINSKKSILKNANIQNPFKPVVDFKAEKESSKKDPYFDDEVRRTVEYINSQRNVKIIPLNEKEIRSYTKLYFNGFYKDRYTDTNKSKDYRIGNKKVSAFVIKSKKQFPEQLSNIAVDSLMSATDYKFYRGYADGFGLGKDLDFDHIYNQFYFIEDHKKQVQELQSKKESFHGARGFSSSNKKNADELKEYLDEISEGENNILIRAHFNVLCFAENDRDFKIFDNTISKKFKEMDISPYYPTGNELANIYNNSFFCFASNLDINNTFLIDLKVALCLNYNVTTYKKDFEGIYFNDRLFNIPTRKDIWDNQKKRIKARNFFILAPTGEGKSFLALHIFRQLLNDGYFIVINDLGGSYEKLARLYPEISLYVKYKSGDPLGINPFYVTVTPDIHKINELVEFVRTLWKRDNPIQEKEAVSLRKLIKYYYENVQEGHSFPNFYSFISYLKEKDLFENVDIKSEFFNVDEFLHNCSEFIGNGSYSFLFPKENDNSQNIDLKGKRLVIFEFDEAKDDPLLISILLSLSNSVDRELIWSDKSTRGYIFYDEFAKQLKFPNVLSSVEYRFQAIRKQTAAIGIVLQSPAQLPENSTASSIIDNTQIFYILHNKDGYKKIVNRFNFNSHDQNQLMSITNNFSGEVKYSEFMFRAGVESNIMRLEVSEAERCAYITEGEENIKIMKKYQELGDMQTAIEYYINKK